MGDGVNSGGIWLGVRELAEMKGVSGAAISKRLKRFEQDGAELEVRREGGKKLVNLAQWDAVTNEQSDPAKLAGAETKKFVGGESPAEENTGSTAKAHREQQLRKLEYEADLKELELQKQIGEVLLKEHVVAAMDIAASKLNQQIDQLPSYADELAAAVSRGGSIALKESLKAHARRLRQALADAMILEIEEES